jgi:hypothetical protein
VLERAFFVKLLTVSQAPPSHPIGPESVTAAMAHDRAQPSPHGFGPFHGLTPATLWATLAVSLGLWTLAIGAVLGLRPLTLP